MIGLNKEKENAKKMLGWGREKLLKAEKAVNAALHDVGFWAADVEYWSKELAKHSTEEHLDRLDREFMEGKENE